MTEEYKAYLDSQNWDRIIRILLFRLLRTKNKTPYKPKDAFYTEVIFEAIKRLYSGGFIHDPERGLSLVNYIHKFIVLNILAERIRKENRDNFSMNHNFSLYVDTSTDNNEVTKEKAMYVSKILNEVVNGDETEIIVANGLRKGQKRNETCRINNIEPQEYTNALRRIKRRINNYIVENNIEILL